MLGRGPDAGVRRDGDGEVLVGGAGGGERDGQVRRDPGHHDLGDPHVAQDGQDLGAVHRGDALVSWQHQVAGPDTDFGDDLHGGV